MANVIAQLAVDIRARTAALESDLRQASRSFNSFGRNFKNIGTALTQAVSLPAGLAAKGAVSAAIKFESAFAGVKKTVNATKPELAALESGIRSMAKTLPASAVEIASVAEAAGQLGIETKNVLSFSKVMIDLGESTNLSANEAADSLARFANVTQMSQDKFSNLGSAIVALGNNSAATEKDIVAMATRLAATGHAAGLSEADIVGFATTLSSLGIEAEAGGTAFSKVFIDITQTVETGGKRLEQFAQLARMSVGEFKTLFQNDAAGAVTAFIGGLGQIKAEGGSLFKTLDDLGYNEVRLRNAVIATAGAQQMLTKDLKTSRDAWTENTALTKEAEQRYGTMESRLRILRNNFNDVGITLGQVLFPMLIDCSQALLEMARAFQELGPGMQKATVGATVFVAALGPVMFILSRIAVVLGGISSALVFLSGIFGKAVTFFGGLAVAGGNLEAVFIMLVAAFGTVVAAVQTVISWIGGLGGYFTVLGGIISGFSIGAVLAGGDFEQFMEGLYEFLGKILQGIGMMFTNMGKLVSETWGSLMSWLGEKLDQFSTWAGQKFSDFGVFVVDQFKKIGIDVPAIWSELTAALSDLWQAFVDRFTSAVDAIVNKFHELQYAFRAGIFAIGEALDIKPWINWSIRSQQAAADAAAGIEKPKQAVMSLNDELGKLTTEGISAFDKAKDGAYDLGKSVDSLPGVFGPVLDSTQGITLSMKELTTETKKVSTGKSGIDGLNDSLKKTKEKVDDATKSIRDMEKALSDASFSSQQDTIKSQIEAAAKTGGNLSGLFDQLQKQTADSVLAGEIEGLKKATPEQLKHAKDLASQIAQIDVDKYKGEVLKNQLDADKEKHKESVDFYKGLMEDAITQSRFSFADQFKKAAVEIASDWLARLSEANISGSGSFADQFSKVIDALGQSIDSWFSKSGLGNLFGGSGGSSGGGAGGLIDGIASLFGGGGGTSGIGPVASGDAYGSMLDSISGQYGVTGGKIGPAEAPGASLGSQIMGYGAAAYTTFDAIKGWDKNGYKGKGGAIGAGGGAVLGGIFGGPAGAAVGAQAGKFVGEMIGGLFSEGKNPQTIARKNFANAIETKLKEIADAGVGLKIFDKSGNLTEFGTNFVLGDNGKWSQGNWATEFWSEFGGKGADQFQALGTALVDLLQIKDGEGGQFGALLAGNLGTGDLNQNLDNIKMFMDSMGISIQQVEESLLKVGKAGKISWLEFETMRQSLAKIPKEGLAAFGDVKKGFQILIDSGGRGQQALNGLKYTAIEAAEAGATTFEALRAKLVEAGAKIGDVDAFFQALSQRGITSVKGLADASDTVLGGVVADMTAAGASFATITENTDKMANSVDKLATTIDKLSSAIDNLPSSKSIDITTTGTGGVPGFAKGGVIGFARGGIVKTPNYFGMPNGKIGMMGEAGPEAILPLTKVNGHLGVSAGGGGGANIYIDARGADAGVEQRLLQALDYVRVAAVSEAVETMTDRSRRGVS